jgi:hypothetical protein
MKIYLICQNENRGYDTYSDAVVAAPDEDTARTMHPNGYIWEVDWKPAGYSRGTWASRPDSVKVELIGEAVEGTKQGVICSSFHAG